jgi:hypothetical protein
MEIFFLLLLGVLWVICGAARFSETVPRNTIRRKEARHATSRESVWHPEL